MTRRVGGELYRLQWIAVRVHKTKVYLTVIPPFLARRKDLMHLKEITPELTILIIMEKIGENMLFSFGVPPFGNCLTCEHPCGYHANSSTSDASGMPSNITQESCTKNSMAPASIILRGCIFENIYNHEKILRCN
jgi:hypothetical protein